MTLVIPVRVDRATIDHYRVHRDALYRLRESKLREIWRLEDEALELVEKIFEIDDAIERWERAQ